MLACCMQCCACSPCKRRSKPLLIHPTNHIPQDTRNPTRPATHHNTAATTSSPRPTPHRRSPCTALDLSVAASSGLAHRRPCPPLEGLHAGRPTTDTRIPPRGGKQLTNGTSTPQAPRGGKDAARARKDTTPKTPTPIDGGARRNWTSVPSTGSPLSSSHASVAHTATRSAERNFALAACTGMYRALGCTFFAGFSCCVHGV